MKMRAIRHQAIHLGLAIAVGGSALVGSGCATQPNSSDSEAFSDTSSESFPQTSEFITTDPEAAADAASAPATEEKEFSDVRDLYQEALKDGDSAISLSQSAFTSQDWQLVVSRWQRAIALLQRIPASHANYGDAQQKLQEFQTQLSTAQQKVDQPSPNRTLELDAEALAAAQQAAQQTNQAASAATGSAAASSFIELCDGQSSLTDDAQHTVQALLELAGTENCSEAATALATQTVIDLGGKEIVDVQPLTSLPQMTELRLGSNAIADLTPLSSLTQLETLLLNNNQIADVAPLGSLTKLKTLILNNNQIANIAPLAALTALEQLELRNNAIDQVTALASLTRLQQLSLSDNQIETVKALSPLTQLKNLSLDGNPLASKSCPVEDEAVCRF
ncbi:MAG: leucine-rich repeat domain-containing protein [Thainema sp.]